MWTRISSLGSQGNVDIIELNETWVDTQNKQLLAEVSMCGQTNSNGNVKYQKHFESNRKRVIRHMHMSNYTSLNQF